MPSMLSEAGIDTLFEGRVSLIGNSFHGVGVSDCLVNSIAAVDKLISR